MLHRAPLLITQAFRWMELMCAAKPRVFVDAMVHHRNDALFAIQTLVCGQPVVGMNDGSLGLFDFQCTA